MKKAIEEIGAFNQARDWDQFHSPEIVQRIGVGFFIDTRQWNIVDF